MIFHAPEKLECLSMLAMAWAITLISILNWSALFTHLQQQGERRIAIGDQPRLLLIGAQCGLADLADLSIHFPDIIAHFLQPSLHFLHLRRRELAIMDGPVGHKRPPAHRAIAKQG